jgi:hypothetical protein
MKCLLGLITLFASQWLWAYPEFVRHGYTSCTACHISPRGGGVLTEYGRMMSREGLSTWGYEGEESWHYGALEKEATPDWFRVGGDFRSLQLHQQNSTLTMGRFIPMQQQVEGAVRLGSTWLSVAGARDMTRQDREFFIPRAYLLVPVSEQLSLRVGRFMPSFGLNVAEHIFSTRGAMGFGYQTERDTVELLYAAENWDLSAAVTMNQLRDGEEAAGFYMQANYSLTSHSQVGLSVENKTSGNQSRAVSLHGSVGLSEKLYVLSELAWRQAELFPGAGASEGVYHFAKLGYEIEKGFHLLVIEDLNKRDLGRSQWTETQWGGGFAFYPRPHLELQGLWTRRRELARSNEEYDFAWLMLHYYL